jgi:group II intron reverse transcriptase/maturase
VLEIDVRKFFDNVDHGHLREILRRRIVDGVLTRLIGKWLNAGVLEDGAITWPEAGTPQGGVISPMLANIFLHAVLDEWFERDVRPRLAGQARLIRYADDAVILFADEKDARRVLEVLPRRLEKYGLTLHPQKTRLVEFRRPDGSSDGPGPKGPGSFDLLGFTHFWSRSRSGGWVVKRKTAKDRFRRALARVKQWCKDHRHDSVQMQCNALARKLTGHFNYFGIIGNVEALGRFRYEVCRSWHKWLSRRSQRGSLTWERFNEILRRWTLPRPRIAPRLANP